MALPKVCIIGAGNLAFHLSKALENSGYNIMSIYSRHLSNAKKLALRLYNAVPTDSFDYSLSGARLYFLCVSDDAIQKIAHSLILPENSILIHCSGSTSLQAVLRNGSEAGVFYPVQTFSSSARMSFEKVPVCIEATSDMTESLLEKIAVSLKSNPYFMNSEQRLTLHLSAVIACNFSNHLFTISKLLLKDSGMPFNLLHHLIAETVQKAIDNEPENVQTGPSVREDRKTIVNHMEMLATMPEWQKLYALLSDDIKRIHHIKS